MALADILQDIEREADAEVARIGDEARREADRLVAAARSAADRDASELDEVRGAAFDEERRRLLILARTEATDALRGAREQLAEWVLERVRDRLGGVRAEPAYPAVLRALLDEALGALPDARTIAVDRRDVDLAETLVAQLDPAGARGLRVTPALETWGGVEVAAADPRLVRDTLEERLARATPYLRPLLADLLRDGASGRLEEVLVAC